MADSPFLASANTNTISQGSVWAVLVQPSFPDLVFEASALVTKGVPSQANTTGVKTSNQPSEFALRMKEAAQAISGPNLGTHERAESEEYEQFDNEDPVENREQETEETKESKRKIVEELWSKLQLNCFVKTDDRELEAATNLLLTLLFSFFPPNHSNFPKFVSHLQEAIINAEGKVTSYGKYNALFTLFNALPAPVSASESSNPLQLSILSRLAAMVALHPEDLSILLPSLLRLPSYLTQWNLINSTVGVAAIEKVMRVCEQAGKLEDAFNLGIAYLSSQVLIQDNVCREVDRVAALTVTLALILPECYEWDLLEDLKPIYRYLSSNPEGKQTYHKLVIMLKSPLTKFGQIEEELKSNSHLQKALSPDAKARVQRKARLLSLTDLCSNRVGGEVKYSEVKDCLGLTVPIEEDDGMEVEEWVINAIKATLITARLHQPSQVLYVTKAAHRSFGSPQWSNLQLKLKGWGNAIDQLIKVVEQGLSSVDSSSSLKGNNKMISTNA